MAQQNNDMSASAARKWLCLAGLLLSACTPSLDWREVRVGETGLVAMLPCRPSAHARPVLLASKRRELNLLTCRAAEATWAVSWIDSVDPTESGDLMTSLKQAARQNLGAQTGQEGPLTVPGAMLHPQAGRIRVEGHRPDGTAVQQHAVFFSRGLVVFQATVLTADARTAPVDEFFSALRFQP